MLRRNVTAWRRSFWIAGVLLLLTTSVSAEERWVAVGYGGRRMISTDGLKWEITAEWSQPGGDDGNNLSSAVFAQGKFVAVGGGGGGDSGNGHVLVSKDGREWKEVHSAKNRIAPIVYGGNRFVAGGTHRHLLWSDDGESWQEGPQIEDPVCTHFRGGAFGNDRFVFVGNHGGGTGPHWVAVSPDGKTISGIKTDLPGHNALVFGAGRFLMLTSHVDGDLIASTDGLAWEPVTIDDGQKLSWIVWTGREFLGGAKQAIFRSTDGLAWSKSDFSLKRGGVNIKWSDGQRFIATAWPGKMIFSADGKTWVDSPPLSANGINSVVRGE
jgi:hypothetical protein